jgi:hypothetical protein
MTKLFQPPKGAFCHPTPLFCSILTFAYEFCKDIEQALRDVLNKCGLRYTIQNEMVYILKEGEASESTGLRLSLETGLLTSPQPVSDKTEEADTSKDAANKWAFRTMLFPQLIPGAACKVESANITAEMKITKAKFTGDNWLSEFAIDIEAEVLS